MFSLRVASTRGRARLAATSLNPNFFVQSASSRALPEHPLQPQPQQQQVRCFGHSNRQIRRLLKNPKRDRLDREHGIERELAPPPEVEYLPIWEPKFLRNGWSAPPPSDIAVPEYPFSVKRTGDKPQNSIGFLPVYTRMRKDGTKTYTRIKKVTGDRERFIQELRAVLELSTPKNPKDDKIRVRTGGVIEVDGNVSNDVRLWLAGLGF